MYSEQERRMFEELGYESMTIIPPIEPAILYRMVAEQAFVRNLKGNAVEALRKSYLAWHFDNSVNRNTKEFDKIISDALTNE